MNQFRSYQEPEFQKKEILRYAGCACENEEISRMIDDCIGECRDALTYKVCFRNFPVVFEKDEIDLSFAKLRSANLRKNLENCSEVIVFAATVGLAIDRLILKYNRSKPTRALLFQAIGAERIESLCDCFCKEIEQSCAKRGLYPRPRFSPGYGDLPLALQRDIFRVLDCPRTIGLTLNDSLLMTPTKSVTAFIGLSDSCAREKRGRCAACGKTDCQFRGEE